MHSDYWSDKARVKFQSDIILKHNFDTCDILLGRLSALISFWQDTIHITYFVLTSYLSQTYTHAHPW